MMKKITFLLAILVVSLGYAQELPFTFTDGGGPTVHSMIGNNGGSGADPTVVNTTDPDDGSNDVLSITGNGNEWDNAQVDFENNIDLSDDANNTITFRFRNTANDGVHTHALKFEVGTTADTELTFTTEDDQWKNITLDFPAGLGNYGKMVIFTDFGVNGPNGTYLIDDIAGATHLTVTPEFVLPVDFSDEINDAMNGDGAGVSIITDPNDAGNKVLEVIGNGTTWDNAQVTFGTPIDLSDDANNTMRFKIKPTSAGPAEVRQHGLKFEGGTPVGISEFNFSTTGSDWQDIEIDFPSGLGTFPKMVIFIDTGEFGVGGDNFLADTYLIDDIMAPGPTLSVENFELSVLKVYPNPTNGDWNISGNSIISEVSVFDVLGKQVISLSPNSNAVKLDASSLKSGMYFAQIKGANGINTVKLIKE